MLSLFEALSLSPTGLATSTKPTTDGFFSGGVVALGSVVLTYITPDMGRLGTRLGMVSIIKGVASLIGPPISGALLGATGSYLSIQLFSAFGIMLTALGMVFLRVDVARATLKEKNREEADVGHNTDDAMVMQQSGRDKASGVN